MTSKGKLKFSVLCITLLILFSSVSQAVVNQNGNTPKPYVIKGRVTIQFEDNVSPDNFQKGFGNVLFGMPSLDKLIDDFQVANAKKIFPWRTEKPPVNSGLHDLSKFYELEFPENIDVNQVIDALQQNPNIRMAEAVWALPLLAIPNDSSYFSQWHMAPAGLDPHVYDAWDLETGSDSVKLAMIDSGVNYRHRDLEGNIWVNPGEDIDGDGEVFDPDDLNGIDDDGNGVVDDLIGYDFFTGISGGVWPGEDGSGRDPDPNDFNGHGTHTAGIAAAMTNNFYDVTGVAGGWFGGHRSFGGARIMCLRVGGTGADGSGYVNSNDCGTAIDYAASNGANVVSASWGSSNTATMQAGMSNAAVHGVTVVHAAGNDDCDCPDYLDFDPATNVLSVASTTSSDQKSGFSNYGLWIDVSAPGSTILSTYSDQYTPDIAYLSGTSMACPMVAGQALLIRSAMPSLTKEQVDSLIINTTDSIDYLQSNPLLTGRLGSGRINVYNSIKDLPFAKFEGDVTEGDAPLLVNFSDLSPASPSLPTAWTWTFGTGDGSSMQNPSYTYNDPGIYDVSLLVDVDNPLGLGEEHLKKYIWVTADTLYGDSVQAELGDKVVIPINLTNTSHLKEFTFAFHLNTDINVYMDSFSVVGTRSEYMYDVSLNANIPTMDRFSIRFRPDNTATESSNYLPPGTGPVVNLFISVLNGGAVNGTILIDTMNVNGKITKATSIYGDFIPKFSPGKIYIQACPHGDSNCDGTVGISDLTALVEYMFNGGTVDAYGGDVNGDGVITISDITYLVDYMFNNGPAPPD